jgi:hypothetical protein
VSIFLLITLDIYFNMKKKSALYLDDQRTPTVDPPTGYNPWYIVRNYDEFKEWINKHGMPDYVSFDHDLADEHMQDYYKYQFNGIAAINYNDFKEKTGLDCAKYMIEYAMNNNINLPNLVGVHSHNPLGALNIQNLVNSYKKHLDQDENAYIAKIPFKIK